MGHNAAHAYGNDNTRGLDDITAAQIRQAIDLFRGGMKRKQIAKRMRIPEFWITRAFAARGIDRNQNGR